MKNDKIKRITDYVNRKSPQYKVVLKYKDEELKKISKNIKDEDLEIELFKLQQDIQLETKIKAEEFIDE